MTALSTAADTPALASAAELLVLRAASLLEGIEDPAQLAERRADPAIERRLAGPEGRVWQRLVDLFALAPPEADLLALAVAVAAEPALGPVVGRAQGQPHRLVPSEALVKRLHGHDPQPLWRPTSPLAMWGLVEVGHQPGEPLYFAADPRVVDWCFASLTLDAMLLPAVAPNAVEPVPPEWPVARMATRLDHALRAGREVRLVVEGRPGTGRGRFSTAVAQALGRTALVVDPEPLDGPRWPEAFMRVQRFALAADVAVVWRPGSRPWPHGVPLAPLQFVTIDEGSTPPARIGAGDVHLLLPEPSVASKARLWAGWAPQLADEADRLAATPGLALGDLAEAARTLPATFEEAAEHLRIRARARIEGAGQVIDPRFGWDDLVLPPALLAQLRRIAFEARTRPSLLEDGETGRLFADSAGLAVLFAGPPGVGKSMAAQVIAKDLGINLLRIDLAATASKYVGETAKNLSAAFAAARSGGAALLFEEADALFAKRSDVKDANDRHANADTSHLLHLMESAGVRAFLTTNRRANIDPAFIRRLHHVVEFERPGPAERACLWSTMLRVLGVEPTPLAQDVARLAESCDLSPAQIKEAVLGAWFGAQEAERAVTVEDLDRAAARELTKEGRTPPAMAVRPRRSRGAMHG
jgi:hypothetical protein